ncbi:MAG: 8-amino-7-oxononanoate synthase [Candidatus Omnitrophica bacterium]|nr:8-amino-7-oxononanoate synthase [Candidatus Omnitrophota bacterium]
MLTTLLLEELQELQAKNLYRSLRSLEWAEGPRAILNGREILLFCGNDYLGLSKHPRVVKAAQWALERYGVGSGSARLISGSTALHQRLEEKLAEFKKKEKALLFTTGYLANVGILTALAGSNDLIVMDKLCHASIIDGARLSGATLRVFPHKNYGKCEQILRSGLHYKKKLIVTDTVFSMDGDVADLKRLVEIKEKYDSLLIVDDAHGTGVLGDQGRGALENLHLEARVDIIMGTLSKALGCLGGFVAADKVWIDYLINFSRPFIFATSLPPMICNAAIEALQVLEEEPDIRHKLWANVNQAINLLKKNGLDIGSTESPIIPIQLGPEDTAVRLSNELLSRGILIPAIRYPAVPKHHARLRLTISATHKAHDIEHLAGTLRDLLH